MRIRETSLFVFGLSCLSASALAQEEPAGLANQAPATSGATDVAQEGFQTTAEAPEESKDTTEMFVSAGGLMATGNSRSLSLTGAANFRLRRDVHQFSAVAAANYGRAAPARGEPVETTVENYQGRARYDLFFAEKLAAFLQVSARRDRFQGLNLRLNIDPGLAYYFIDDKALQFWSELGYDFQYDVRRDDARLDPETGNIADKTEARHNGRAFVGYDNKLSKAVSFYAGVEYLQGLSPFEDDTTGDVNWRLNVDTGLTSKVAESLSIATTLTVKYDNNPLPGLAETDTVTAVNLVYNLY